MARYKVLREGVSQRENGPGSRIVDRPIGAVIEVSDLMGPQLVEAGLVEPVEAEPPAKPADDQKRKRVAEREGY